MTVKEVNEIKNKLQLQAIQEWSKTKKGLLLAYTGFGKSRLAMLAMEICYKLTDLPILFIAETTLREETFKEDCKKFGVDIPFEFVCYQSIHKLNKHYGLVIYDEFHELLTDLRLSFRDNCKIEYELGITATINTDKKELQEQTLPIVWKITTDDGLRLGIINPFRVYVIEVELDNINKNIECGSKTKRFFQTERGYYDWIQKEYQKAWIIQNEFNIKRVARLRANFLYNTIKSKDDVITRLINAFTQHNRRMVVFSNSLNVFDRIGIKAISSKNSKNKADLEDFNNGKINVIGSFKMLKQGANLENVDTCIIHSFYSTSLDLIQRQGRVLRYSENKEPIVAIVVLKNTQDEKWLEKLNIQYKLFSSIDEWEKQYKLI